MELFTSEGHRLRGLEGCLLAALAGFGDADASRALQALAEDPDPYVRKKNLPAVLEDARARGLDVGAIFSRAWQDPDREVRDAAFAHARAHPDPAYIPTVLSLLRIADELPPAKAGDDPGQAIREAELRSRQLTNLHHQEAREAVREIIRNCRSEDPAVLDAILGLIADAKCPVAGRIRAIQGLCYPHHAAAITAALLAVLDGDEPALQIYASEALSYARDDATPIEQLQARLDRGRPEALQESASYAIAHIAAHEPERCTPILLPYLEHPDLRFQEAAVLGLRNADARQCAPQLRALLAKARSRRAASSIA